MNSTPTPSTGNVETSRSTRITERRVESEPLRVIQVERITISEEQRSSVASAIREGRQAAGRSE